MQKQFANVLLLGTGEAGKSTFVKQMKLINAGGFTDEDKAKYRIELVENVIDSVVTLSRQMMNLGIAYKVSVYYLIKLKDIISVLIRMIH